MSEHDVTVTLGDEPGPKGPNTPEFGPQAPPEPAEPPAAPAAAAQPGVSLLDEIHSEIEETTEGDTIALPVGSLRQLKARYRILDDDELGQIASRIGNRRQRRAKPRDRRGPDIEALNQKYAALLGEACVEMIAVTEHGEEPLHEHLTEPAAYRYDMRLIERLGAADILGLDASSSRDEIVAALHATGPVTARSYAPLRSLGATVERWMAQVSSQAIEEVLEGM